MEGKSSSNPNPGSPALLRLTRLVTSQEATENVEMKPNARKTMAMTSALRTAELPKGKRSQSDADKNNILVENM
jgi:hypothetical protein